MTLEKAIELLDGCQRWQRRDPSSGAVMVYWRRDGRTVATGLFETEKDSVWFIGHAIGGPDQIFVGDEAESLRIVGTPDGAGTTGALHS